VGDARSNEGELIAFHYPILLDEQSSELAVLTHVGRPGEQIHGFGERDALVIIHGEFAAFALAHE
jgi:transcriptional regulator